MITHSTFLSTVTIGILAITLAGCAVGPDYKKPETSLPSAWQATPGVKPVADEKIALEKDWWKHFNDPVLDQLIAKAASGNLDLKTAEARIAEARAGRSGAVASLLPSGDVKAGVERQANELAFPNAPPSMAKPFNVFQSGFDASWEVDLFGGKRRALEAANADLATAEAARDNIRVSLLAEVARTYVEIRQYQAQLALVADTIKADTESAKIASERFKSGSAPRLDLDRAQAHLGQTQTQQPLYQNLLAQAEFNMDVLLGEQPGVAHGIVVITSPIPSHAKEAILAAPATVIANRPDIHMAERQLASTTAQHGVAVAQLFPNISLSGFVGVLSLQQSHLFESGSKSWNANAGVIWPILSYGSISAGIDAADARQQQALAQYQKTILAALSDVERSMTAYVKQEEFRQGLAKTVEDDRRITAIARMRYREGLSSFLEVLDAERTQYASENQLAEADARVAQNLIALYKSLGGGWKEISPPKPDEQLEDAPLID